MNKKEVIASSVLAGVVLALVSVGWLPWVNALGLFGVAGLAGLFRKETLKFWIKCGLFVLLVPLVFFVATYRPPEFSYPLLLSLPDVTGPASRFNLYVNFSKALVGFWLLYLLWPRWSEGEFVAAPQWRLSMVALAPALIIAVAIPMLGLGFQLKTIEQMLLFGAVNLFAIAMAEEAFMRLLLQQPLRNAIAGMTTSRWVQELLPLFVVTVIFVAIHSGLSGAAVWVYALAGFLYGLSYTLSKNVFYPIAIHFLVNQIHFSLLIYPL